jgi:hypothetical protein
MFSFFKRFFSSRVRANKISVEQVANLIKTKYPQLHQAGTYNAPQHRCSKWIALRGPCVGSESHWGTLIVDAKRISGWAHGRANRTWTSCEADQAAKQLLPGWLENTDESDETVTILDRNMLSVLQPYDQDFIYMLAVRHWCPKCSELHDNVIIGDRDRELRGKTSRWTSEWYCLKGHLVHAENNQIRFF